MLKEERSNETDLAGAGAILIPFNNIKGIILAKYKTGTELQQHANVTAMADLAGTKYFSLAKIIEVKGIEYVVSFDKIFRLQRRNTFSGKNSRQIGVYPPSFILQKLTATYESTKCAFLICQLWRLSGLEIFPQYLNVYLIRLRVLTGSLRIGALTLTSKSRPELNTAANSCLQIKLSSSTTWDVSL